MLIEREIPGQPGVIVGVHIDGQVAGQRGRAAPPDTLALDKLCFLSANTIVSVMLSLLIGRGGVGHVREV